MPDSATEPCLRLAELSGTEILGIELRRGEASAWQFSGAHPLPDLRIGGEALLDHLAAELTTRATQ